MFVQPGPDLLFLIQSKWLYVLELTVGFKSNLNNNAVRKKEKYLNLNEEMSRNYRCVKFVNLSISSLGVFSYECSTFLAGLPRAREARMGQSPILMEYGQPLFVWLSRDWPSVRTYASTDCTDGVGETVKRKGGVSQPCLCKSSSFI